MSGTIIRKLSSSGGLIEDTYANIAALKAAGTLNPGSLYKITDRADEGIVLLATDVDELSVEGEGIFLNPDFQGVGDYTGVVGYNATRGVWYAGGEAGWVNGDIVFWDGFHYLVIDDASFAGTDPTSNPTSYSLLTKSETNGYIKEVDFILFDFSNNYITKRTDRRANEIIYPDYFQFGNDNVYANTNPSGGYFNIINQRGTIFGNTLVSSNSTIIINNTNEGFLTGNVINGYLIANLDSGISYANCNFNREKDPIILYPSLTQEYKSISETYSTFSVSLDMTDGQNYSLATTTLTIPAEYSYFGVFTLNNNSGATITKIAQLPELHEKSRFYVQVGNTQIFSHTAIGVAVSNNLVSDAAAVNTITGRANGSDFIEYEKSGTLNRRYNAVILA